MPPGDVAKHAFKLGLSPLFVTDHDTIEGALRLKANGWSVVVGQEISTADGDVIGLFLESAVPAGMSASETARQIKAQGGLVYLQHPFDRRRHALSEEAIEAIMEQIDLVEVFNGRSSSELNAKADALCASLGATPGVGSDAHSIRALGRCFIEMPEFSGSADFLVKLGRGRLVRRTSPWRMRLRTAIGGSRKPLFEAAPSGLPSRYQGRVRKSLCAVL